MGSIDTSGEEKSAQYLAQEIIEELGPDNIVAFLTDSAANAKLSGQLVTSKFAHIFWVPCTAHCLDLLLEDIGKMEFAAGPIAKCKEVVNYIRNHQWSHALLRSKAHAKDDKGNLVGCGKEIVLPGVGICVAYDAMQLEVAIIAMQIHPLSLSPHTHIHQQFVIR